MPTQYAFITDTFDAEYMLMISAPNGKPLVTVGMPSGPSVPREFCLWEGAPEPACEDLPDRTFRVDQDGPDAAWARAVRAAYDYAIAHVGD